MRYPASEKLEIIRLVERSHLPVRQTLGKLGIAKTTFYRWYYRYQAFGTSGLEDRNLGPGRVWNRIPDDIRNRIVDLALEEPELSPRELAVKFTDTKGYFVSEASVYRLLKAQDLITSPAFVVIKASSEFKDKTTAPNQLWQTDFNGGPHDRQFISHKTGTNKTRGHTEIDPAEERRAPEILRERHRLATAQRSRRSHRAAQEGARHRVWRG